MAQIPGVNGFLINISVFELNERIKAGKISDERLAAAIPIVIIKITFVFLIIFIFSIFS